MQRYAIRTIIYNQESIIYLARVCHGMEWNGIQRYFIRTIIYNQESIIYLACVCHGMEWNAEVCHYNYYL